MRAKAFLSALVVLVASAGIASAQIAPPPNVVAPVTHAVTARTAQTADVNVQGVYTAPVGAGGLYRASCFVVITQAATTSSTMPSCSVTYTQADTGLAVSALMTSTTDTNLVGNFAGGTSVITAQAGSGIGFTTGSYASSGATPMQYTVRFAIEALQ